MSGVSVFSTPRHRSSPIDPFSLLVTHGRYDSNTTSPKGQVTRQLVARKLWVEGKRLQSVSDPLKAKPPFALNATWHRSDIHPIYLFVTIGSRERVSMSLDSTDVTRRVLAARS